MKVICKFIRKHKSQGFELVTWTKHNNGSKECTIRECSVTASQLEDIENSKYHEINVY